MMVKKKENASNDGGCTLPTMVVELKNYEYNYERKNTSTLAMVVNGEGSDALPMVGKG
jgi:hypothetical protein